MNKTLIRIMACIFQAIITGIIYKYTGFECTILVLLSVIYVDLLIKGNDK